MGIKRRALLLAVVLSAVQQRRHADVYAFVYSPAGVHVAFASTPVARRSTRLRVELSEDDYSDLMRRVSRLERTVSDQNAEVEEMKSSMEHMRMIIQIQAQIDSCLIDGGELLSSSLGRGAEGKPDPRLVKQAIRLLRMRHRVLRAWEFSGEDVEGIDQGGTGYSGDGYSPDSSSSDPRWFNRDDSDSSRDDSSRSGGRRTIGGETGDTENDEERRRRRRRSRMRTRDGRPFGFDDEEFFEYSMYDEPLTSARFAGGGGRRGSSESTGPFEGRLEQRRPPKTNQDAADAAGAGVVAALMEGRRRLIVEVDDAQLRYNSPEFCHEAMTEFVELLVLPLTTALENLKARQNRCKIVIQGAQHAAQVKEAMVLDAPDSLQVVSLEDAKVAKKDRVVALVAPENWKGKRGKHLKRVLAEAHDSAIILINPTDADKFLAPADFNTFELVYHLSPMRVNYLQPLPLPPLPLPQQPQHDPLDEDSEQLEANGGAGGGGQLTGEALLLERLGESVREEEDALTAVGAAVDSEEADGSSALDLDWGSVDIGYRDSSEWAEREDERLSDEAAAAAIAAWSEQEEDEDWDEGGEGLMGEKDLRWGAGEVGEWDGGSDEAAEMTALAVTLRQYPGAWEAFVDLHDGMGFRLCGTWDLEPPQTAVQTVVMDHILRIVMD